MDLLLRGRGANIGARAPSWFVRILGATLGFTCFLVADVLSVTDLTGFSPIILGTAALIVGALVATTRFGSVLWMALVSLSLVVLIVCYTPVMLAPAKQFVRADMSSAPVDAVVVLSGSMTEEGLITREPIVRLLSGIAQARQLGVRTIAMSVISEQTGSRGVISSERDQRALVAQYAPDLELLLVRDVKSTHDEALQFVALGRTHRWQRVAVVTSPTHTKRACKTFETLGLAVTCRPSDAREYSLRYLGGAHSRLNVFRDVMYETLATLLYRSRGWM